MPDFRLLLVVGLVILATGSLPLPARPRPPCSRRRKLLKELRRPSSSGTHARPARGLHLEHADPPQADEARPGLEHRPPPFRSDVTLLPRSQDHLSEEEIARRLDVAITRLQKDRPNGTALTTLNRNQRRGLLAALVIAVVLLALDGKDTLIALMALSCAIYLSSLLLRLRLIRRSFSGRHLVTISDADAVAVPDDDLPVYTVLVPAFGEPAVIPRLLSSLSQLNYPPARLDVKLLLEEDDGPTRRAVEEAQGAQFVEVILVPSAEPRTKPKALNYGLQFAKGDLVTIFDAEDRPDPLQLRKAVLAFRQTSPEVACLQAELRYFNPSQNLLTRWFAIEYLMWFSQFLPGLSELGAPVPLGGTSNHFRRHILDEVGGWDPFNVTEDADLGLRLHRCGYRTGVLDSVTLEEANSDFINWVRQRSRWYKGYLQTWLVHLRQPRTTWRDLGASGFAQFNLFVGGTPLIALLNPVFWIMTILWFVGRPTLIRAIFPAPVYYTGLLCMVAGNFVFFYSIVLSALESDLADLFVASLLTPLYWIMMSLAATKAFFQLLFQPTYWEKTVHGLDAAPARAPRGALVEG